MRCVTEQYIYRHTNEAELHQMKVPAPLNHWMIFSGLTSWVHLVQEAARYT
jgi:hypothetical protein